MLETGMKSYAIELLKAGVITCPLNPGTKHIDFVAMGYPSQEQIYKSKYWRKLAHQSLSFTLMVNGATESECRRWFSAAQAGNNIGVVCASDGLTVLDFDSEGSFWKFERRNTRLVKTTPVERTPSGYHVYVKLQSDVFCKSLYIRGKREGHVIGIGGFVTCAPSVLDDGRAYSWLPGQSILEMEPQRVAKLEVLGISQSRLGSLFHV
jgi:hypothetical protein